MKLEIGAAQWCCQGETVCGDAYGVFENGETTTILVVDGLGHGPGAAKASQAFVSAVEQGVEESDLELLMEGASKDISGTRGAQAVIFRIDTKRGRLSFVGIGNVETKAIARVPIRPISMSGIVGRPIHKLKQFDYEITKGDLVALFSDGISSRFDLESYRRTPSNRDGTSAKELAEVILKEHGRNHDDATCVIVVCGE